MITFTYLTNTLTLPNPKLSDSDQVDLKTRFGKTYSGAARSYKFTPVGRKILMTFETVRDSKSTLLQVFLQLTHGKQITLLDWYGRTWTGYIINNPIEIVDGGTDKKSFVIEFEGTVA